jgi:hypothetical protein
MTDAQMDACMSDRDYAEALVARFQETSTADEIDSTPSFVIDGEKNPNMGYDEIEAKLNEALGS